MTVPIDPDLTIAWTDRSDRLRLRITGPDRVRFLQNLTTNDVGRLQAGQGLETFITSPPGKTLGYATLHAGEEDILLRSDSGAFEPLSPHFEKYGVFDDVSWRVETDETFELHVFGPRLPALLDRVGLRDLLDHVLSHRHATIDDHAVHAISERPAGCEGVTFLGSRDILEDCVATLERLGLDLGLACIDPSSFDVLRIEAGTPVFGKDVTPANLPQEIDRDDRAISFTKGCYLGQETVARIDALGHVNKLLRGLRFAPGPVPAVGTALLADGKAVGTITSSGFSTRFRCPVGLGYVRRGHAGIGQELSVGEAEPAGTATVVALPMRDGPESHVREAGASS